MTIKETCQELNDTNRSNGRGRGWMHRAKNADSEECIFIGKERELYAEWPEQGPVVGEFTQTFQGTIAKL